MKKLVVLLVLLTLVFSAFAQEAVESDTQDQGKAKKEFDLELNIGFPVHWTNSIKHDDPTDKEVTANTAIGLALLWNLNKKVGITVDTDFFYGGDVMGISSTDSKAASLFGANLLVGPVIYLYHTDYLRVPLALGVHAYYYSSDIWAPSTIFGTSGNYIKYRNAQFGPGAYLGVQFHFNSHVYIYSRTNVAIDVVRWHQTKGPVSGSAYSESEFELTAAWEIKPAVGIGIKF